MSNIRKLAENPWLNFISGVILITTSGNEILKSLDEESKIGAHHGVAIFGLVKVIQVLPHILHGAKEVSEINKK